MRKIAGLICTSVILFGLTGCQQQQAKEIFVVTFAPDTTLKYKFVSERSTLIRFGSESTKRGRSNDQKITEKLEMVIAYKPVEVDPYGLSTIEATCLSSEVIRKNTGKGPSLSDAMNSFSGQTYRFQVTPSGKIADYSQLTELVRKLGEKTFSPKNAGKRIKSPDMIVDFIAFQWYIWDSTAAIKNPLDGVALGQEWTAYQLIPMTVMSGAKETTYRLEDIEETDFGKKAVIKTSFAISDKPLENWPEPYTGKFGMKGMLGFMRNYRFLSIEGDGEQIFNINRGVIESDRWQYKLNVGASLMLPLPGAEPSLTVDQKMSVELLEN